MAESPNAADVERLENLQSELHQREREIVEAAFLRRSDALDRIRDAVSRLGELGSPAGILARAATEIGLGSPFDRVLISEVREQTLIPLRIWDRADNAEAHRALSALREFPAVQINYPLIELDVISECEPQAVEVAAAGGARSSEPLSSTLGWDSYVVAPILVEDRVIGMLHADAHASGRELDALDLEIVSIACSGLGEVFERAVLRETLQRHRAELESAVNFINGRLRGISSGDGAPVGLSPQTSGDSGVVDALTPREREILALMARGQTNASIAEVLVVREGTVKYHVKNILRKLGARSRADAVAKYIRSAGALPG